VHVVVNMAASLDGRVAGPGGQPVQLSGEADLRRVHALRAASDAVVVGAGTVAVDDPRLTARPDPRPPREEQPLRVVVTSQPQLPARARVLDDAADTLVLAGQPGQIAGADVHPAPGEAGVDLAQAWDELAERGVEDAMVEGGPTLVASLLAADLVDRFMLYTAPRILGEGPSLAAAFEGLSLELEPRTRTALGEGTLTTYGVPP